MNDSSLPDDGNCHALTRLRRQCTRPATPSGAGCLCTQHRDKLRARRDWPLTPAADAVRAQLLSRITGLSASSEDIAASGATAAAAGGASGGGAPPDDGRSEPGKSEPSLGRLFALLRDPRVVGSTAVLLVAFFSEYLFLRHFGIDFALFLSTADTISLFIKSLSGLVIALVVLLIGVSLCVSVNDARRSYRDGTQRLREERQSAPRKELGRVEKALSTARERERCLRRESRATWKELVASREALDRLRKSPRWLAWIRAVGLRAVIGALVAGSVSRRTSGAAGEDAPATAWEQVRRHRDDIEAGILALRARYDSLEQRRLELRSRITNLAAERERILRDLNSYWSTVVVPTFGHFHDELRRSFSGAYGPTLLDSGAGRAALLAVALVAPLAFRHLDGLTMRACVASATASLANTSRTVCPVDGFGSWSAADTGVHHWLFAHLREHDLLARNYPVVSVMLNESRTLSAAGAGLARARSIACDDAQDRLCARAPERVSSRMVYLGDSGPWTLLHQLGPGGSPLAVRSAAVQGMTPLPVRWDPRPGTAPRPVQVQVSVPQVGSALASAIGNGFSDLSTKLAEIHGGIVGVSAAALPVVDGGPAARRSVIESLASIERALVARRPPSPRPGPVFPVRFTAANGAALKACRARAADARFPFDRDRRRLGADDPRLVTGLAEFDTVMASHRGAGPLLVLVEGTADSTGSPQVNVEFSEARASFVHRLLEARLRTAAPSAGDRGRVVFASWGSGEWADLDPRHRADVRAVLVRVCDLNSAPASTVTHDEGIGLASDAVLQAHAGAPAPDAVDGAQRTDATTMQGSPDIDPWREGARPGGS